MLGHRRSVRTRASRSSPGSGPRSIDRRPPGRASTTAAASTRYDELVLATGLGRPGPPDPGRRVRRGPRRGRVRAQGHGRRDRDRRGRRQRAGGRSCSAPACSASRSPPAWRGAGLAVAIVHLADRLMERQLGWEASQVAVASLERLGITTHVGASVVGRHDPPRPARERALRATASRLAADLFVMCCGTVAETMLARRAGLTCRPGRRRRRRPREPRRPARARHRRLRPAARRVRPASSRRAGSRPRPRRDAWPPGAASPRTGAATHDVVRVKASGMSMVSMGVCGDFDRDDPRYRVLSLKDPERGRYVEVVVARRPPRRCDLHRRRGRRRDPVGALHPLAAGPRRPRAAAGAGARRRRPGIRGEAARGARRRRPGVHLQLGRRRAASARRCAAAAASVADVAAATRASTGCGDCAGVVGALVAATDRPGPPDRRTETLVRSES